MILRLLIWLVVQVSLVVKCKKLDLVERRINVQEFQKPIPEEYRPVQFKDRSTRRVNITGVFVYPCYKTKFNQNQEKSGQIGSCGLLNGQDAYLDIRFKVKGIRSLGLPRLTTEATIGDCFGKFCPQKSNMFYDILHGWKQTYPMGEYEFPCQTENSKLECPVRADLNGENEHQVKVKLALPKTFFGAPVPETNLTGYVKMIGRYGRRRAHLGVDVPLETIIN